MNGSLNTEIHNADVCVIGGGLSGCFAASEAACGGARVLLMQDRPVLGGNASTEIRMLVRAKIFIDCSGDSILAELVGAEYRQAGEPKESANYEYRYSL